MPSDWINIGTTLKQPAKQSDFLVHTQPAHLSLLRGCWLGQRPLEVDAVRIEHGTEPCIFGAQTCQFANLWRCVGVANGMATFPSPNTNCWRVVQSLSFG
ncbi:hypothetical protein BTRA_1437 [Burkholderia thailandensis USAMRU Malaysia |nr:hypothetical protein BTJ_3298 [Burkholderia thailandensis E444]AIC87264.1 hypothetical protein BTRA_1437 [Burkholderia thailandensis USAMRU Malaysia \